MRLSPWIVFVALVGCDPGPSDVREWRPSDHDPPENANQNGQVVARSDGGDEMLVELAWSRNCATCHGPIGHGDGPQGPMLKAPDLTLAEWQDRVSDEDIRNQIRKGRNKMPAFDLPPQVLDGLVKRIRMARGR